MSASNVAVALTVIVIYPSSTRRIGLMLIRCCSGTRTTSRTRTESATVRRVSICRPGSTVRRECMLEVAVVKPARRRTTKQPMNGVTEKGCAEMVGLAHWQVRLSRKQLRLSDGALGVQLSRPPPSLRSWWNGRHVGLKSRCQPVRARASSTLADRTSSGGEHRCAGGSYKPDVAPD